MQRPKEKNPFRKQEKLKRRCNCLYFRVHFPQKQEVVEVSLV